MLVALAIGPGVLGASLGLAVFAIVNHLAVALPVAVTSGVRYRKVLLASGPIAAIHTAGNVSVGLLAG